MKKRLYAVLCAVLLSVASTAQTYELPRSTPEEQGVPSHAVLELFDSLHSMPQTDIHSLIIMRHGKIIGEFYPAPFAPQYKQTQYSSSKTLVSMAIGIAIDENRLRLTDRIATFFPEYLPDSISSRLASITVRDMLTMQSGIKPDWGMRSKGSHWIKTFLGKPVANRPGEVFAYDSMVTYILSAIVQRVTGKKLLDYLKEKLFWPMGISDVNWEESPEGVNSGGWGLHIQSESLAKIGQLWLDGGLWRGERLISEKWIMQMSTKQADGGDYGYGFQTWMCAYPGAVRADGALGQYVIVVPQKDVVIVLTEASFTNGKPQRGLIWNRFLPQLEDTPMAVNKKEYSRLVAVQKKCSLPTADGKKSAGIQNRLLGKKLILAENRYGWRRIAFEKGNVVAKTDRGGRDEEILNMHIVKDDGSSYIQPLGYKKWITDTISGFPPYSINPIGWHNGLEAPFHAAGSYGWNKDTLNVTLHYVDWITSLDLQIRFEEDKAILYISNNYIKNKIEEIECTLCDSTTSGFAGQ